MFRPNSTSLLAIGENQTARVFESELCCSLEELVNLAKAILTDRHVPLGSGIEE
jgi:hypothetical protein